MAAPPGFRALAQRAARKHGVPTNVFLALIGRESGWDPKAGSPAGAVGLVQIHLPSHPNVTRAQAENPGFAVNFGARYLATQKKRFGSWRLALAAYNAGPGRVEDGSWTGIGETVNYVRNVLGDAATIKVPKLASGPLSPLAPAAVDVSAGAPTAAPDFSEAVFQNLRTQFTPAPFGERLSEQLSGLVAAAPVAQQTPQGYPSPPKPPQGVSAPPSGPSGRLAMPLGTPLPGGSEFAVSDAEGAPSRKGGRYHAGKDWFAPAGSAVVSPVTGRIVEVKQSRGNSGQVFGGVVKVQAPNGRVYVFRHVNPAKLKVGQRIGAGAQIAQVTPWTDGSPHAHIEIWKTLRGGYQFENMLDPARVFGR